MRTSASHPYHGITCRNDAYGWTIQIKLLGSMRFIRTFAGTAEEAARRHDVALNKLRAFAEPHATPNFPASFPPEPVDMATASPDYRDFHAHLNHHFHTLIQQTEARGQTYDELFGQREEIVREAAEKARQVQGIARSSHATKLLRLARDLPNLGLPPETLERVRRSINEAVRLIKEAQ